MTTKIIITDQQYQPLNNNNENLMSIFISAFLVLHISGMYIDIFSQMG